jgi:hypothetical protein
VLFFTKSLIQDVSTYPRIVSIAMTALAKRAKFSKMWMSKTARSLWQFPSFGITAQPLSLSYVMAKINAQLVA